MIRKSEWVSIGHPDKTADFISERLLDKYIEQDPKTRYAVEVQVKDQHVTLAGEVTSTASFSQEDFEQIVREAVIAIGYTPAYAQMWAGQCINPDALDVRVLISEQSPDIAAGAGDDGWGDQGIFFGYAEYNSDDMMPREYLLAQKIGQYIYQAALASPWLGWGLDIKTQVVMQDGADLPSTVIVAVPMMDQNNKRLIEQYIRLSVGWTKAPGASDEFPVKVIINGTGTYKRHSSVADCGTTGRKLAVDFYGGNCRIGGGSPWTKDGSKADLTLNLYARELACDYASKLKKTVTTSLACCIGSPEIDVTVFDEANNVLDEYRTSIRPAELINRYKLDTPIFSAMCYSGLFGFPWEWNKKAYL